MTDCRHNRLTRINCVAQVYMCDNCGKRLRIEITEEVEDP